MATIIATIIIIVFIVLDIWYIVSRRKQGKGTCGGGGGSGCTGNCSHCSSNCGGSGCNSIEKRGN